MSLDFIVLLDLTGSGSATVDITPYVKHLEVSIGKRNPVAVVPDAGTCQMTLNNADKRFSPAYTSGPYYGNLVPNRPVIVRVKTTKQWFIGWTKSFKPTSGQFRERECTVECFDLVGLLQISTIYSPVRTNMTGDQLVAGVISTALNAPQNTATLNWSGLPPNNSTVAVTYNGVTTTYRFVSGAVSSAYDVAADTIQNSIKNLIAAVMQTEGNGTTYISGTPPTNIEAYQNSSLYALMKARAQRLYRFGESGGTTAADAGSQGQAGTYSGGFTLSRTGCASGDPDTGVALNGSTGKVTIPTYSFDGTSFTVEVWVKPVNGVPAFQTLYGSNGGGGANNGVFIYILSGGQVLFRFSGASDLTSPASSITYNGTYQHVVCTYNVLTKTRTIYVNGVQKAQDTGAGPIQSASVPVCTWGTDGSIFLNGTLDECALDNIEVSGADVLASYNAGSTAIGVTLRCVVPGATGCAFSVSSSTGNITASGAATGGQDYPALQTSYDVGVQTFPRAGQNWNAVNAMTAVQEITQSENGRFYVNRDGVVYWKNRQWWFKRTTATTVRSLNGEPPSFDGELTQEAISNVINVKVHPQDTQSAGVVAQSTSPFQVPGKGSITVKLPFIDPVTSKQGSAANLILPLVAGTDWVANEQKDNSGVDYATGVPGYVLLSYVVLAGEIQITITNNALGPLYMTKLQVRGQVVTSYNPITIEQKNTASIQTYRPRLMNVDLAISQDVNYATVLAQYLLNKYKDPQYRLASIDMGVVSFTSGIQPWDINIDDVFQISENQLGITNQKYLVIGASMQIDVSGGSMTFQYALERLDDVTYWVLDDATYSVLGTTTRLAV